MLTGTYAEWMRIDENLADHEEAYRAFYGPSADQNMDLTTLNLRMMTAAIEYVAVMPPAPTVVDVPYAAQEGDQLTCTMGNWEGDPEFYRYQWQTIEHVDVEGVDTAVGEDIRNASGASVLVTPAEVGKTVACVVTVRNITGPASVTSNEVLVSEPVAA